MLHFLIPAYCSSSRLEAIRAKHFQAGAEACGGGGGAEENESGGYSQWPLQTPSMINVKGFRFLICQSFQRSLTYAYLQPRRSHHSGRWSGTSKPFTSRLCCACRCQRCKLAHLQPFIMHCSKEQLVFLRPSNVKCRKCDILQTKLREGDIHLERQVSLFRWFAVH